MKSCADVAIETDIFVLSTGYDVVILAGAISAEKASSADIKGTYFSTWFDDKLKRKLKQAPERNIMSTPAEESALKAEKELNTAEYDANFDGEIQYSERAGLLHYDESSVVVDDDVVLGEHGFEAAEPDEELFEEIPGYAGDEDEEPAVDGIPDGADEAEAEMPPVVDTEDESHEHHGFLEEIVDESALPEHVKEVLNMEVGDALREIFHKDEKTHEK